MKKIGVLGTGEVGRTIATKLVELGYEVKMGSRTANNENAEQWTKQNGEKATAGTFAEAVQFGEIIFNCTKGEATMSVFQQAGLEFFDGKIVIDQSNSLDLSNGFPPTLLPQYINTTSLGEEIQKMLPKAYVVKTLNTVNCELMTNPEKSSGEATMLLCGNNAEAKQEVTEILHQFGWKDILDLGEIVASRGMEMFITTWVRLFTATNNINVSFKINR
ncbi:MAG: hypothetical protein DAHOPDDO_02605 [Ignavibacteriaceae bacterium]|nr:hypothetical protein [Ignavibacteriaceae bacterium]